MQSGNMRNEACCRLKTRTAGRANQLRALKGRRWGRLRWRLGCRTGPSMELPRSVLREEANKRAPALGPVPH
eukprot:11177129-Lingulodinium_polyedra.AAC.1